MKLIHVMAIGLVCVANVCVAQRTAIDSIKIFLFQEKYEQAYTIEESFLSASKEKYGASDSIYAGYQEQIAEMYYRYGEIERATKLYWNFALIIRENKGEENLDYVDAISRVAYLYELKGNFVIAKRMYEKCYSISKSVAGKESVAYAKQLDNLGRLAEIHDDYEIAEDYYLRSSEILQGGKGEQSIAYAHNIADQAHLYYLTGHYTASEALFRQSKYIYEREEHTYSLEYAMTLRYLAQLDIKLNNSIEAIELLHMASDIVEKKYSLNHPEYAAVLSELARVYLNTGYPEKSKLLIEKTLGVFEFSFGKEHLQYLETQALQALYFSEINELHQSDSLINEVLESYEEYMGTNHLNYSQLELQLASLYYKQGKYEDALGINQRIVELYKEKLDPLHPDYAKTINNMAMLYWAMGESQKAHRYYENNINNYVRQYKRYFPFLSEKEKGYFYGGIQLFFEEFNSFAIQEMKSNPSILSLMYNSEIATKSLLFHTSKDIRNHVGDNELLVDKYKRWVQTKELLAKISKLDRVELEKRGIDVEALENKANYLEKEISLRVEKAKEKDDVVFDVTWENIRDVLKPGEAAIEMFQFDLFVPDSAGKFLDQSYYAALVITSETKGHPDLILIENGKELEGRDLTAYKNFIRYKIQDKKNYGNYWKPIISSEYLKGIDKIYFSPDGVYNQISLNTLFNPETNEYVLDEIDLHLLANTKDILHIDEHTITDLQFQKGEFNSVLFGFADFHKNPYGNEEESDDHHQVNSSTASLVSRGSGVHDLFRGGGEISELPGTKVEIESIENVFQEHHGDVKSYMGGEATELNFKNISSPNILHVATHGFFMQDKKKEVNVTMSSTRGGIELPQINHEENPLMRSGIMLASAKYAYSEQVLREEIQAVLDGKQVEDGVLTAYEAINLDLTNTELVVLSACETGLGVVKNGEGVYGLQRSLQTAGAKSIIMSLWKVNDEATQKFMVAFYKEWFKEGDKRVAFEHAQKMVREEYSNPYFWGAFVLVGH